MYNTFQSYEIMYIDIDLPQPNNSIDLTALVKDNKTNRYTMVHAIDLQRANREERAKSHRSLYTTVTNVTEITNDALGSFNSGFYDGSFTRIYEKYTDSKLLEENKAKVFKHMFDSRNKVTLFIHDGAKNGMNYSADVQNEIMNNSLGIAAKEIHDIIKGESCTANKIEIEKDKDNISDYQKILLDQAKALSIKLPELTEISIIEKAYGNFEARIHSAFSEKMYKQILITVQKPLIDTIQKKCIDFIQKSDFDNYKSWSLLLESLIEDTMTHPLLDAILQKIAKKYKGKRIILGPGSVQERSLLMYNYILGAVNAGLSKTFKDKESLDTWYNSCVERYGFD